MNFIPYSIASCSPLSLETCIGTRFILLQHISWDSWKSDQILLLAADLKGISILKKTTTTDLSSVIHVTLVAQDHLLHVRAGMLLDVPDPVLDVVETLLVGNIVDKHDAHGPAVVSSCDRPEPLLTRRVPDLKFDLLSVQLNCADLEVNA